VQWFKNDTLENDKSLPFFAFIIAAFEPSIKLIEISNKNSFIMNKFNELNNDSFDQASSLFIDYISISFNFACCAIIKMFKK